MVAINIAIKNISGCKTTVHNVAPRGNSCTHRKNTQTPHRKTLVGHKVGTQNLLVVR